MKKNLQNYVHIVEFHLSCRLPTRILLQRKVTFSQVMLIRDLPCVPKNLNVSVGSLWILQFILNDTRKGSKEPSRSLTYSFPRPRGHGKVEDVVEIA